MEVNKFDIRVLNKLIQKHGPSIFNQHGIIDLVHTESGFKRTVLAGGLPMNSKLVYYTGNFNGMFVTMLIISNENIMDDGWDGMNFSAQVVRVTCRRENNNIVYSPTHEFGGLPVDIERGLNAFFKWWLPGWE